MEGEKHCKLCYIHKFLKLHFTPSVKSGNAYWLVSSLWRHIVSKCVVATLILNRVFLQPQDLRCKLADQVIVRVVPFFVEIGVSIRFYIMVLLSAISDGFDQMISVLRDRAYYLAIDMFHFWWCFKDSQKFCDLHWSTLKGRED